MKTSTSHPLQIGSIDLASGARIGLTFCPGKVQPGAASGAWDRDLDLDLDAIEGWGADLVLSLLEREEFDELKVPQRLISEGLRRRGICWLQLPIPDFGTPGADFETQWSRDVGPMLRHRLRYGGAVVLHCKGGLGRTGTIAARLLVELGESTPGEAILRVRKARPGAIENRDQERHVESCQPGRDDGRAPETESKADRLRGCLLGGAIGDALGAGIEFDSLAEIREKFGREGVTDYVPAYGLRSAITDDTQMTLFTVEGLCRSWVRGAVKGICDETGVVGLAYRRWALTQGVSLPEDLWPDDGEPDGWLIRRQELHSKRAPGNTCLSALRQPELGTTARPINDSKGCGTVMRVAPVGFLPRSAEGVFNTGCAVSALTHGHPSGYLSAGTLAVIIHCILRDLETLEAIDVARALLRKHERHEETDAALDQALRLALDGRPTPEKVESLGGGWIAEEALAIAVYCALVPLEEPPDRLEERVRRRLLLAVNHSGDSDSTGSITGQILGARHGVDALPADLLSCVESKDLIETLAVDLQMLESEPPGRHEAWWNRYPGW